MVVSKKDKAFILLIISAIIVLWFVFSLFSYLFSVASVKSSDVFDPITFETDEKRWLNISDNITKEDLEGRIVLVNFWNYDCFECISNIRSLNKLKEKLGDKISIIGVHVAEFDSQKSNSAVKNAIVRHNVEYPVINDYDQDILDEFKLKSWPKILLVSQKGSIVDEYSLLPDISVISEKVKKLVKKYSSISQPNKIDLDLENKLKVRNVLNFPEKIEYAHKFKYRRKNISALIVSNSASNHILISNFDGKIISKIGSKSPGFKDGNFKEARFNYPTGLLYSNGVLYVADRGNNAIRKVDFSKKKVSTVKYSGDVELSSPNDLEYFPNKDSIVIANSGSNQILKYDIEEGKLEIFAGNGNQGLKDDKSIKSSLANPVSLSVKGDRLYFVDSKSSSLRYINKDGDVKTLIGSEVGNFGNENGSKSEALMQSPFGVYADRSGIYVADSYNHLVKKYDSKSKKISSFSGNGKKGDNIGSVTSYNEVADLVSTKKNFYILDRNNNRVVIKSKSNGKTSILDILPALRLPQDGLLEYLPNLEKLPDSIVSNQKNLELVIKIGNGWKINENAPSFFNLVEISGKKDANLIASYDWNMVKIGKIRLPKLSEDKKYYLQGTIYYCEDKKNALCFIHSYESKVLPQSESKNSLIEIKI